MSNVDSKQSVGWVLSLEYGFVETLMGDVMQFIQVSVNLCIQSDCETLLYGNVGGCCRLHSFSFFRRICVWRKWCLSRNSIRSWSPDGRKYLWGWPAVKGPIYDEQRNLINTVPTQIKTLIYRDANNYCFVVYAFLNFFRVFNLITRYETRLK